jgi:glyoxylase I family protein
MFKRIDHIELLTADPARAERFYTEVLGFRVRERATIPGGLALVYLDLGGTTVELMCYADTAVDPAPALEHIGYRMIALEVEDMGRALDFLKGRGVETVWGPVTRPAYARAEIRDPDGNHIELRQWISSANLEEPKW